MMLPLRIGLPAARDLSAPMAIARRRWSRSASRPVRRRSTLYTHFWDKEEILAVIAENCIGKLEECSFACHALGPAATN